MDEMKDIEIDLVTLMGEELPVAPKDVYHTKFKGKVFGGYNRAEVDAFLEKTAASYEAVVRKLAEAAAENDAMRAAAEAAVELRASLRALLARAEKFSEEALENAKREGDALIAEARMIKERAILEARQAPAALRQEIESLKDARNRLRADLIAVLDTHASLIENIPTGEAAVEENLADFEPEPEPIIESIAAPLCDCKGDCEAAAESDFEPGADTLGEPLAEAAEEEEPILVEREPWLESRDNQA